MYEAKWECNDEWKEVIRRSWLGDHCERADFQTKLDKLRRCLIEWSHNKNRGVNQQLEDIQNFADGILSGDYENEDQLKLRRI